MSAGNVWMCATCKQPRTGSCRHRVCGLMADRQDWPEAPRRGPLTFVEHMNRPLVPIRGY